MFLKFIFELCYNIDLGADAFVCSPYKFFGPHMGVMAANTKLVGEVLQAYKGTFHK